MKRMSRRGFVSASCLILIVGGVLALRGHPSPSGSIYTPTQLLSTSVAIPMRNGAVVRLRGVLICHGSGIAAVCVLTDPDANTTTTAVLKIGLGAPNPLLSPLRRLPLVGALVPSTPDHPVTAKVATYTVSSRICPSPHALCEGLPGWVLESGGE